ncbi:MAG TPA: hypothetical protein VH542_01325 [Steroidobacteraceae bacterium]
MRWFTRPFRWLAPLVVGAAALAGCKSTSCDAPPDYGTGESIPPLNVPAGLDAPDTRNALKVPELKTPDRPRTDVEGCLDAPPSYFPERTRGDFPKGDRPQTATPSAAPFHSQAPAPPIEASPLPSEVPPPLPTPAPQTTPSAEPQPPQPQAQPQAEASPQAEPQPPQQPEAQPEPQPPPGQS